MVDDLEIAKRAQAAQQAAPQANPYAAVPVQPSGPLAVNDQVNLSESARNIVNEVRQTQSIAEAWLRNKTETPDLTDPRSLRERKDPYAQINNGQDDSEKDSIDQKSLSNAFQSALTDIGWLVDALGVSKYNIDPVAEAISARAASNGVGVNPPVSVIAAQAQQSGSSAALYLENLSITVQKGKTVDVSVDRVVLTTVNASMTERFSGTDKPLVLDVGGGLQDVAGKALGSGADDVAITPAARADQASKTAEILLDSGMRSDDQRHALLIVREGGKLHPQGTLKLKMDVLQPIR